ncbi:MAG: inositol monophosphatase family protein [bacterium]
MADLNEAACAALTVEEHAMIAEAAIQKGKQHLDPGIDDVIEHSMRGEIEAQFDKRKQSVFIFGEEEGISGLAAAPAFYFIDPKDGSGPNSEGFPHYGMSIGVYSREGDPLVGLYHLPELDETFLAKDGNKACLNGKRLKMPPKRLGKNSYIIVSSDTHKHREIHNWRGKIRAYGVSGLHLCLLAAGRKNIHAVYLTRYKYHDIAAGAQVLIGAGGVLINVDDQNRPFELNELASTDPKILDAYGPRLLACHPENVDELVSQLRFKRRKPSKVEMSVNWLEYRGDSVLFDNPGNSLVSFGNGFQKIHCDVDNDPELEFYKALATGMKRIGLNRVPNLYHLCPLPSSTYHATLFDGYNVRNRRGVLDSASIERFLDGLPGTIHDESDFTTPLRQVEWLQENETITFKFDRLSVFGNSVLVARLKPDKKSKLILKAVEDRRRALIEALRQIGDVGFRTDFKWHVSLGYFAASTYEDAIPLGTWNRVFKKLTAGKSVTFKSASLYGFLDMVTYFK